MYHKETYRLTPCLLLWGWGMFNLVEAGCKQINIGHTFNHTISGTYSKTGSICTNRNTYEHEQEDYVLYHLNKYWIINTDDHLCTNDTDPDSLVRVWSLEEFPEDIYNVTWQEWVDGHWVDNINITVSCGDKSFNYKSIIIGCTFGGILLILVLICLINNALKKKKDGQHEERMEEYLSGANPAYRPTRPSPRHILSNNGSAYINNGMDLSASAPAYDGLVPGPDELSVPAPAYDDLEPRSDDNMVTDSEFHSDSNRQNDSLPEYHDLDLREDDSIPENMDSENGPPEGRLVPPPSYDEIIHQGDGVNSFSQVLSPPSYDDTVQDISTPESDSS